MDFTAIRIFLKKKKFDREKVIGVYYNCFRTKV